MAKGHPDSRGGNAMYSEQRKAEIVRILEENGSVDVNRMAESFQTSRETIRRDLSDLELQGVLKRTHGGAVLDSRNREYPIVVRGIQQVEEKKKLCQIAASFVKDQDTLFVDNSSTLLYLPRYLPAKMRVTILTNSINFLLEASKIQNHDWLMICLGGILNASNLSVYGPGAIKSAGEYYPNKTFFSCAGISPDNKIADSSLHEIEAKRMMIARAQETFLLADSTKFKKAGPMYLCDFNDVDYLITNAETARDEIGYIKNSGVKLVLTS